MAKEDASDGRGREAANNRVEQRGRIRKRVRTIVATENVTDDPSSLVLGFAVCEFGGQEMQDARCIWIAKVPVVENIIGVPEVGVDGYDAEAFGSSVGVCAVVRAGVLCFAVANPAVLLPPTKRLM